MRWKTTIALLFGLTSTFGLASSTMPARVGDSDRPDRGQGDYRAMGTANRDANRGIRSQAETGNPYTDNGNLATDNRLDDDQYRATNNRSAAHHQAALRAQANRQARLDRLARRTGRAPRLGFGTGQYGIVDSQGMRYRRRANVYNQINPPPDRHEVMAEKYATARSSMEEAYLAGRNPFGSEGRFAYGTGGTRGTGRGINRIPPGAYSTGGTERTGGNRAVRGTVGTGGTGRNDIYGYQDIDRGADTKGNTAGGNEQRPTSPSTRPSSNQSRTSGSSR